MFLYSYRVNVALDCVRLDIIIFFLDCRWIFEQTKIFPYVRNIFQSIHFIIGWLASRNTCGLLFIPSPAPSSFFPCVHPFGRIELREGRKKGLELWRLMPKATREDKQTKDATKRLRANQSVPLEMDTSVLPHFQLKCDRSLPLTQRIGDSDPCVHWMGSFSSHDLRRREHRDPFIKKVNGTPIFYYRNKEYSARNMAYALVRRDFCVLKGTKGRRVRLSSDCQRPGCINPWHHRILPPSKAKREVYTGEIEIMDFINGIDESKPRVYPLANIGD